MGVKSKDGVKQGMTMARQQIIMVWLAASKVLPLLLHKVVGTGAQHHLRSSKREGMYGHQQLFHRELLQKEGIKKALHCFIPIVKKMLLYRLPFAFFLLK